MELTRRDLIAALGAAGIAVGGRSVLVRSSDKGETGDDKVITDETMQTLVATAAVLYPSEVENIEEFVRRYIRGREDNEAAYAEQIASATAYLDRYADAWYDTSFAALSPADRQDALEDMRADTADPDPNGSDVERVRYYVINELLFALYATPTGGKLVGLENPQGHPGGLSSYRHGPPS